MERLEENQKQLVCLSVHVIVDTFLMLVLPAPESTVTMPSKLLQPPTTSVNTGIPTGAIGTHAIPSSFQVVR